MNHRARAMIAALFVPDFFAGFGLGIFTGHQSNLFPGPGFQYIW